jgi:hypothetical protein
VFQGERPLRTASPSCGREEEVELSVSVQVFYFLKAIEKKPGCSLKRASRGVFFLFPFLAPFE